jgi:hypothetical protein
MSRFKLENFVLAKKDQHTYLENGMIIDVELTEDIPQFFAFYLTDMKPPGEIILTNKTYKSVISAFGSYTRLKPDAANHHEKMAVEDEGAIPLTKEKRIFYLTLSSNKDCSGMLGIKFRKKVTKKKISFKKPTKANNEEDIDLKTCNFPSNFSVQDKVDQVQFIVNKMACDPVYSKKALNDVAVMIKDKRQMRNFNSLFSSAGKSSRCSSADAHNRDKIREHNES